MNIVRWIFPAIAACAIVILPQRHADLQAAESPATWSHQIAPIVYRNCTVCHHPGGGGPFSLMTYAEVRRRGQQILDVTQSRYMPPWLPALGYGDFADSRRMSDEDVALLKKWVDSGMPEGDPGKAMAPPHYDASWQLGKPDLILSVERPYALGASGTDVFRNFILPYPLGETHFIRAMEILPGTPQVVHHANVLIDRTASLRRQHARDWKDGIPGMELELDAGNTFDPDSHFLFWKPDTPLLVEPSGMPWRLDPGNDLILNMHLKPSGKPETIDAKIGLYFSEQPATQHPMLLQLDDDQDLDIPAGAHAFVVHDELTLPLDVEALGVYPHAHYLGRELEGWAILPDGQKKWLIRIPNWDIDRQSVYRYRNPVFLPRGSVLHMHYVYDNSDENIHNPNSPPIRVRAGNRSVDEMAHLWIQVLPVDVAKGSPDPRLVLEQAWMEHRLSRNPGDSIAFYNLASSLAGLGHFQQAAADYRRMLSAHPSDPRALNSLGAALEGGGDSQGAEEAFSSAIAADPDNCDARFNLATVELKQSAFRDADRQFRMMLEDCSGDAAAHTGLGVALMGEGDSDSAEAEFRSVLTSNPRNFTALYHLGELDLAAGRAADAVDLLLTALQQNPDDIDTRERLAMAFAQSGRSGDALIQLREAARLAPGNADLHALLSQVLGEEGNLREAIEEQNESLHLQPQDADGWNNLGVLEARNGRPDLARADFQHALQLAPDDPQARANLARLGPH
ncbi:MAG TPA: tetratricopeptide repeat protein [Acidobacteriaceae bacterium]|jgi:Flp pilus assembly protein TadD|nr:tetratricopeptide repeat protein [Acidobacteriaceae bacterium]